MSLPRQLNCENLSKSYRKKYPDRVSLRSMRLLNRKLSSSVFASLKKRVRMLSKSRQKSKIVQREVDLERRLFRIYKFRCRRNGGITLFDGNKFHAKLARLVDKWSCPDSLKAKLTKTWLANWCKKYGVTDTSVDLTHANDIIHCDVNGDDKTNLINKADDANLEKILLDYDADEVYLCFCFQFCWSSLPDKVLGAKVNNSDDEIVILLMAANRTGHHRTRICVVGKEWRPDCLKYVNMLSQPVVYAGGGNGLITADLFAWWFYHEFSPGALTVNRKVALLAESKSYLSCNEFVSTDSRAKLVLVPDLSNWSTTDNNVIEMEFRLGYAKLLLSSVLIEDRSISINTFLSHFTLKDAFPLLHKAWLAVRIESFLRFYRTLLLRMYKRLNNDSSLSNKINVIVDDVEERNKDGHLLLELQWFAHDLGLEIADEDLIKWAYNGFVDSLDNPETNHKIKFSHKSKNKSWQDIPNSAEAATHLSKALAWMETQPFDPNYLLFLENIIFVAKQVCVLIM